MQTLTTLLFSRKAQRQTFNVTNYMPPGICNNSSSSKRKLPFIDSTFFGDFQSFQQNKSSGNEKKRSSRKTIFGPRIVFSLIVGTVVFLGSPSPNVTFMTDTSGNFLRHLGCLLSSKRSSKRAVKFVFKRVEMSRCP